MQEVGLQPIWALRLQLQARAARQVLCWGASAVAGKSVAARGASSCSPTGAKVRRVVERAADILLAAAIVAAAAVQLAPAGG